MWLSIGFVIGCVITVFYYQTLVFTLFTLSVVITSVYFKPFLPVLLGFICGILCVWVHFLCFYAVFWQSMDEKQPNLVTFEVIEIISQHNNIYLKAKITSLKKHSTLKKPVALVSLTSNQEVEAGDRVTTWLRLKKYRNQKNFDGFDKERYAFSQHILFKAKQITPALQIIKPVKTNIIHRYRTYIKNVYQDTQMSWLYYALMTGDKGLMSYEQKQTFQQFGLSHLLAISGLHIGLMFSIGFFITKLVIRSFIGFIRQTLNLSLLYCIGGFSLAFCYVYLSDFLVSATRALIMLGCYLLVYFYSKQALKWRSLLFALVLILILEPFSLLNLGLYFSFFAVVVIFSILSQLASINAGLFALLKNLTLIQLALFIGLLPLSLYFFNGISLIGVVVNLIAIPLLSFIIMPSLVMFSALSSLFYLDNIIILFDFLLKLSFDLLLYIPHEYRWLSLPKINLAIVLACYLSALMIFLVPTKKFIALLPLALALLDTYIQPQPRWQVDVFDVGHGTMVLISTQNSGFVYDLGPIYFNQYTRINSTLLPHLENNRINVKHTVISHQDKDHAGGLSSWLAKGYQPTFKSFHPNGPRQACVTKHIDFAGLLVQVSKNQGTFTSDNDSSCVIRISDNKYSVLLPGDITSERELELIQQDEQLKSTVLLSPHHGSKTSSSEEFINAVSPDVVVHSASYQGQWKLPHAEVKERYRQKGVIQYSTAEHGQIQVKFYNEHYEVNNARRQSYWFLKD